MRWRRAERSANLEDRRGEGVPGGGRYGAGARLGLGGVVIHTLGREPHHGTRLPGPA
jgi:predicted metalloprotease